MKERLQSIVEALENIRKNSSDCSERGHATGILTEVASFKFLFFLNLFCKLLGITNSASEALQSDTMDLTAAMLLINFTLKCLHHSRKGVL